MAIHHVIVDGSNIATEGRTAPSLVQLDEAVRAFLEEYGHPALTVVVDATFGHRIEDAEHADFEAGIVNGELVTPPAGAIGRGDAFVLQIAAKTGATIFSNDSFQEFHGTYEWLFDEGRLIGGKPVPNVGWVFVPRTPVRGPTSRRATREGRAPRRPAKAVISSPEASAPMPVPTKPPPVKRTEGAAPRRRGRASTVQPKDDIFAEPVSAGTASGTDDSAGAERSGETGGSGEGGSSRNRRRRTSASTANPLNEPMAFLAFVSEHPVGSVVEATVDRFSSHGAYVIAGGTQCYIPLKAMADPPPTKAREVLTVGEVRAFVVTSFDPPRRGIDVSFAEGAPSLAQEQLVADQVGMSAAKDGIEPPATASRAKAPRKAAAARAGTRKATAKKATTKNATTKKAPAKKATAKKATAKKATATKGLAPRAAAGKGSVDRSTGEQAESGARAKKAASGNATAAKKLSAAKASSSGSGATKAAETKKQASKSSLATAASARKAPAKRGTAATRAASAEASPAPRATAKRAEGTTKSAGLAATKAAGSTRAEAPAATKATSKRAAGVGGASKEPARKSTATKTGSAAGRAAAKKVGAAKAAARKAPAKKASAQGVTTATKAGATRKAPAKSAG